MTRKQQSQLPDWMLNPEENAAPTTLTWSFGQWLRSRKSWRAVADRWWRFQSRSRISQRYPKTAAIAGWFVAVVVLLVLYFLIQAFIAYALAG